MLRGESFQRVCLEILSSKEHVSVPSPFFSLSPFPLTLSFDTCKLPSRDEALRFSHEPLLCEPSPPQPQACKFLTSSLFGCVWPSSHTGSVTANVFLLTHSAELILFGLSFWLCVGCSLGRVLKNRKMSSSGSRLKYLSLLRYTLSIYLYVLFLIKSGTF